MVGLFASSAAVVLLLMYWEAKARIQNLKQDIMFLRRLNSLMIDPSVFTQALADLTAAVNAATANGPVTADNVVQPFIDGVKAQTARLTPQPPPNA